MQHLIWKACVKVLNSHSYKKRTPTLTCPFPVYLYPRLSTVWLQVSISLLHRNQLDPFVFFISNCFSLVIYSICFLLTMWSTEVHIAFPSIKHVTPQRAENSELHNQIPLWKSSMPRWCMLDNAVKPSKVVQ